MSSTDGHQDPGFNSMIIQVLNLFLNLDLLPGGKKNHLRKKPEYAIEIRSLTGIVVLPSRGT